MYANEIVFGPENTSFEKQWVLSLTRSAPINAAFLPDTYFPPSADRSSVTGGGCRALIITVIWNQVVSTWADFSQRLAVCVEVVGGRGLARAFWAPVR